MTSPGSESPEGVTFLTSLLVRFPELGSACLAEGGAVLLLDFYLQEQLLEHQFEVFREQLILSWEVFFDLQRMDARHYSVSRSEARRGEFVSGDPEDDVEVDSIQIQRDIETLSLEELTMVVTLVREAFERALALNEEMPDDEAGFQEEVLHRSLERLRAHPPGESSLTGFRDDMRVLIYSSEERY
ncbi:MAG: hypothetical protein AB7S38_10590 [Vulcanimicrobiota bacterium]